MQELGFAGYSIVHWQLWQVASYLADTSSLTYHVTRHTYVPNTEVT